MDELQSTQMLVDIALGCGVVAFLIVFVNEVLYRASYRRYLERTKGKRYADMTLVERLKQSRPR
jgi:hypothetical protein